MGYRDACQYDGWRRTRIGVAYVSLAVVGRVGVPPGPRLLLVLNINSLGSFLLLLFYVVRGSVRGSLGVGIGVVIW